MNKQEVIEKIKKEKSPFNSWEDLNRNNALDVALDIVEKLDEKAKPVVLLEQLDKQQPLISSTPPHYQGTIQPIDIINAQNLNFNLGNVVKYVCRAGKKQGENVLSDLEKAKNYINYEIERIKKNE